MSLPPTVQENQIFSNWNSLTVDIVQLTDADDIHGYSGVISKDGTELFYTQGDAIKAIHLETLEERVACRISGWESRRMQCQCR